MYKKLDENTIDLILENGISEFVEKGYGKAAMSNIAKRSGVSVGVIYKYFDDKSAFFMRCVDHSLELLDRVLREAVGDAEDIRDCVGRLVHALIKNSREHDSYNAMYHEITSGGYGEFAAELAERIERRSAEIYRNVILQAQEKGIVKNDDDPGVLAFFLDNLLLMMQFSYSCDYYRERMKIFCGDAEHDDEAMEKIMIRFIEAALGVAEGKQIR